MSLNLLLQINPEPTQSTLGTANPISIAIFFVFVAVTLYITYWAAKKTKTGSEFYAAGRNITGFQNGLALSGDYMSAASFLGIAGMVATKGYDGLIYSIGFLVGWPLIMFLVAEPLRNLGKYTFADVVAFRLKQRPIRIAASIGSLLTISFYLIAQMVGAGSLIKTLFGLDYEVAIIVVGIVMTSYVLFGGMLATTWVQIIKAVLLLGGATMLVILAMSHFDFSPAKLFNSVRTQYGADMLAPGGYITNPFDALSLGLALMLGTAGLPHILMRFYTVPDDKAARKSVFVATGFIGYFYVLTFFIGFAALALVGKVPIEALDKGGNMAALLLAEHTGGSAFLGFIASVAFATILAVVAGLTLSGASTISHDLYVNVIKKGVSDEKGEIKVAKKAASANFPALLMSIIWKGFTTRGAVWCMVTGAVLSLVLIVISPTVWVDVLGNSEAIFPLKNPTIVSMTSAFIMGIVVSLIWPEKEASEKFESEKLRTYLGVGSEQ